MKKVKALLIVLIMLLVCLLPAVALAADEVIPDGVDIWEYIQPEVYSLVPVLFVIGLFIKKIPGIPDWLIPIILLVLGVIGALLIIGFTIYGFIQGVLVAGAAVFIHQLGKQVKNGLNGTG